MQKILNWYRDDIRLQKLLDDGWKVIFATPYSDGGSENSCIHYILEKHTRKEKLEYIKEIADS